MRNLDNTLVLACFFVRDKVESYVGKIDGAGMFFLCVSQ